MPLVWQRPCVRGRGGGRRRAEGDRAARLEADIRGLVASVLEPSVGGPCSEGTRVRAAIEAAARCGRYDLARRLQTAAADAELSGVVGARGVRLEREGQRVTDVAKRYAGEGVTHLSYRWFRSRRKLLEALGRVRRLGGAVASLVGIRRDRPNRIGGTSTMSPAR